MKTENLEKAFQTAQFLSQDIRAVMADASRSKNQFAEIAIFDLLKLSVEIEQRLRRLNDAAK